ncbi:MAG: protein kinase [Rhodoferax sp.]|nr:protein kinase [Rhodoferax sp.]MDP3650352.1 protein kinase [Rhodoferax sp.]
MDADYVRRCPSCETEHAPQVMRCGCGALLVGVDLVSKQTVVQAPAPKQAVPGDTPITCPFDDCAQANPAGSTSCLYCNRPLNAGAPALQASPGPVQSLLTLPTQLRTRYRILHPLPTQGAEAELLLVEAHSGGPACVAKIYRHGIQPRPEVQERIARIAPHHRVEVLEFGVSEGYAYELMEYCGHGSLRQRMQGGPLAHALLLDWVHELSQAIDGVHAVGLIHRDLKPENILVRSHQPLDLVLTDFGISSVLDATQRFTGTARTLPYAAPESLSGVIDGKADYWALGMVILEGALGQHPFAGLSEAVILHHLATRSMDLAGITDRKLRKLLRGLLLRDPQQRWGMDEITRWRADDPGLPEPAEQGVGASFHAPYHLARDVCHSKEQLAVALSRNWREGVADMANGQLQTWFREVQKDQNTVRLLLELRYETPVPVDVQLLKLILHLAPGIPPVWRGETIELPAILSRANQALKGDTDAAQWLHTLYQHRVLETYASAGNEATAGIVQKWGAACAQFARAWDAGQALIRGKAPARGPDEFVNFDQVVYGKDDSACPSMAGMHARLLAMAYDAAWSQRLRQRLTAELAEPMVYCPWLAELGDLHTMDAATVLVLEALLPEAKKVADRQIQANARHREAQMQDYLTTKQELSAALLAVRTAAQRTGVLRPHASEALRTALDHYFEVLAKIKASGRADAEWQTLRKLASRTERVALQMGPLVDSLAERREVNAGWFSAQVLGFAALALFLLPILFGNGVAYWLMAAAGAAVVWRLAPLYSLAKDIRALAARV